MHSRVGKTLFLGLCLPALTWAAVACSSNNSNGSNTAGKPPAGVATAGAATAGRTATAAASGTRTVADVTGPIQVPANVQRIGDNWPANNEVILMLGGADKIVATSETVSALPWFQKIYPRLKSIPAVFTSTATVNLESLLGARPDVVIYFTGGLDPNAVAQIKGAGISTAQLFFTDFETLKQSYMQTAQILGGDAPQRATEYVNYLSGNLDKVTAVTKNLPQDQRPKILHIAGPSPLVVDGGNSIMDSWIQLAGGVNVAASVNGAMKTVTIEQIIAWNPDLIIVGSASSAPSDGIVKTIMNDPAWSQLSAVKNGKIIINPKGLFFWDRASAEEALQVLWAARKLHPDLFPGIDIAAETKAFYLKYYNYKLTDDDVSRILASQPPQ